jgi:hypothetical protein
LTHLLTKKCCKMAITGGWCPRSFPCGSDDELTTAVTQLNTSKQRK